MQSEANDKLTFWRQKLRELRRSGLSGRAFCERNGIKKSSLDYWFGRLGKRTKPLAGLVELKPALPPTSKNGQLEVVVGGRYRVEVHGALDRELFCEVVKALESLG